MITERQARKLRRADGHTPITLKIRTTRGNRHNIIRGLISIPPALSTITEEDIVVLEREKVELPPELRYQELLNEVQSELGNGSTSKKQLEAYISEIWDGNDFDGIHAPDDWGINMKKPYSIINTQGAPGEHWMACYMISKNNPLFYDSFGRSIISGWTGQRLLTTEEDAEQDISEDNCGQRCVAWLLLVKEMGWRAGKKI